MVLGSVRKCHGGYVDIVSVLNVTCLVCNKV